MSLRTMLETPLIRRGFVFAKALWSLGNDWVLNIKTVPRLFSTQAVDPDTLVQPGEERPVPKYDDRETYQSPDYHNLRHLIQLVHLGTHDVVYDLGAGMGRVVCLCARQPIKRCVGVEISQPLCEIARQNANRLRGRRAPIEIVCEDVAVTDVSEGTIYIMFNAFGEKTLQDVLANIRRSLDAHPRQIRIVYFNDLYTQVFESCGWLEKERSLWNQPGKRTSFWHNTMASELLV